jgi:integral membrane protein
MFKDAFSRFRIISLLEGISFLILVFIAMPIKYIGENPYPVKIAGMGHGVLFILFCIFLLEALKKCNWDIKVALKYFILSLIPFGFILIEKDLKKQKES